MRGLLGTALICPLLGSCSREDQLPAAILESDVILDPGRIPDSWRLAHPIDLDPLLSEEGASFQLGFELLKELTGSSGEGAIRKALSQIWPTARPESWLRDLVRLDPLSVQVQDGARSRYWKVRAAFQILPSSRSGEVLGELVIPLHPSGMRAPGRTASLMVPFHLRFVPIVEVQPVASTGMAEDSHLYRLQGLPVEFESAAGEAEGWRWSVDPPARFLESPASLRLTRKSPEAPRTGRIRIPFQWQGRTLFLHVPIEARAES